jgi:TonB family protein
MSVPCWFQNLLSYSLQIAVLAAAGIFIPRLLRLRAPRGLLAFGQSLLAACLLLPWAQPWHRFGFTSPGGVSISSIRMESAAGVARGFSLPVYSLLLGLILFGILFRFLGLALGLGKLRSHRDGSTAFKPLPAAVAELQSRLGVRASFFISPTLDGPATFGFRNPTILLPRRFLDLSEPSQRGIVCHELLHVARRDWVFNLVEEVIVAFFWFHPAVRWLVSRIRLWREQVVDAEVVECLGTRKPYMYALLEIAAGEIAPALRAAPAFLSERQLARRIELLVKEVSMSKARLISSFSILVVVLILAGGLAVRAFPLKVPVPVIQPTVATNANPAPTPRPEQVVDPNSKGVVKPLPIYKPDPPYTKEAKDAKVQGTVILKIVVDAQGNVSEAKVTKSLDKGLDESAVNTVKTWKFKPATKNGKLVTCKLLVEVSFRFF